MKKRLELTETELYGLERLVMDYIEETDLNENKKFFKKMLKKIQEA